jgi:hypothetical protein
MIQVLIATATHSYCNIRFYFLQSYHTATRFSPKLQGFIATEAFASANATHSNNEALASLLQQKHLLQQMQHTATTKL